MDRPAISYTPTTASWTVRRSTFRVGSQVVCASAMQRLLANSPTRERACRISRWRWSRTSRIPSPFASTPSVVARSALALRSRWPSSGRIATARSSCDLRISGLSALPLSRHRISPPIVGRTLPRGFLPARRTFPKEISCQGPPSIQDGYRDYGVAVQLDHRLGARIQGTISGRLYDAGPVRGRRAGL